MFNFLNISGKGMENVVILAVMAAVGFFLWRYLGQQSQAGAANAGTGAYQVMGGTGGSVNQLENLALLESLTGVSAGQSSAGTIQPVTQTGSNAGGKAPANSSTSSTGQGGGGGSV